MKMMMLLTYGRTGTNDFRIGIDIFAHNTSRIFDSGGIFIWKKNEKEEKKQKELNREESQDEQIRETGQVVLDGNSKKT